MNTPLPAAPPAPPHLRSLPGTPPWQSLPHMTNTAAGLIVAAEEYLPPADFLTFLDTLAGIVRDRAAAAYAAAAPITAEEHRAALAAAMRRHNNSDFLPTIAAA